MESWKFLCLWKHKAQTRSGYAQGEAKYKLCFFSKVQSRAGKKQGRREQGRRESLVITLCAVGRGFPPHKFSHYHQVSWHDGTASIPDSLTRKTAMTSCSVPLQMNSEAGPWRDTSRCFLFQKGTTALQSQQSFPTLSGNEKANLDIFPSLFHEMATERRGPASLLPAVCTLFMCRWRTTPTTNPLMWSGRSSCGKWQLTWVCLSRGTICTL